jgi:DNA-binding response OmpR family regulator
MHLLVIEDNPDLVANLVDYLESRGHTVDVAFDGWAGLQRAMDEPFDALVLDLMLPGLDGVEVCRRLRGAGRGLPVLMLTARDTLQDKLEGFAGGADDYLVKPFALQELEVRLAALVRRSRGGASAPVLRVADLELDPESRRVRRGGRTLELPPISLRILELLLRESPRVVSRAQIERAIWGDSPPDSDALRAHMHLLRAAIDHPFTHSLLRTVRGVGYQLADPDEISP